jgi:hypothetical protein
MPKPKPPYAQGFRDQMVELRRLKTMKHENSSQISDTPRLRVGLKDVTQPEFSEAITKQMGKHKITIMLDDAVVQAYKARAGGRGY